MMLIVDLLWKKNVEKSELSRVLIVVPPLLLDLKILGLGLH